MKSTRTIEVITARSNGFQSGVAAVEFALLVIVLLLIIGGIVEFGRTFWHYDALAKATRDGARFMSSADKDKLTDGGAAGDAIKLVKGSANDAGISPPLNDNNVRISCLDVNFQDVSCQSIDVICNVKVTIQDYDATPLGSWFPLFVPSGDVKASVVPRFEQQTTMRYLKQGLSPCP